MIVMTIIVCWHILVFLWPFVADKFKKMSQELTYAKGKCFGKSGTPLGVWAILYDEKGLNTLWVINFKSKTKRH